MPSTTVHLPDPLLERIDRVVKDKNMSRNRFIVQACEQALQNLLGHWPKGFFEPDLDERDRRLLRDGVREMQQAILSRRTNRKVGGL